MADKRQWAKFDVGYLHNPKLLDVLDVSHTAVLMHTFSVLYSAQHLTDGVVPVSLVRRYLGGSQEDVDVLVEVGLWHGPDHDCTECEQPPARNVVVHNYLEHNRSESDVNKATEAAKKAAAARWSNSDEDADQESATHADRTASGNADRMRTALQGAMHEGGDRIAGCYAEREEREERSLQHPAGAESDQPDPFDQWWTHYPKKVDKGQARRAFKSALKKTTLEKLIAGAQGYAAWCQRTNTERRFIKNPSTWLNAEAWDNDDELTPARPEPPARPTVANPGAFTNWSEDDYRPWADRPHVVAAQQRVNEARQNGETPNDDDLATIAGPPAGHPAQHPR